MNTIFQREDRKRSRTFAQWAEGVLLTVGLLCFCWFGYNWLASQIGQVWSNYSLDARLAGTEPTISGLLRQIAKTPDSTAEEKAQDSSSQQAKSDHSTRKVAEGEDIGRIEIPRLKISAIVRQGIDDGVLGRAVGHVPNTSLPGEPGNVGLAAHRDSYFRNLRDVREGDVIKVVTPEGTWQYAVDSTQIVEPENVEVLDPTPSPSLTLVTCYPFYYVGHAPKRFIVRARQLDVDEGAPRTAAATPAPSARSGSRHHSRRRS